VQHLKAMLLLAADWSLWFVQFGWFSWLGNVTLVEWVLGWLVFFYVTST